MFTGGRGLRVEVPTFGDHAGRHALLGTLACQRRGRREVFSQPAMMNDLKGHLAAQPAVRILAGSDRAIRLLPI